MTSNYLLTVFVFYLVLFKAPVTSQTVNFTVLPFNQDVVEGGNATFECAANDGTQPYTVVWRLRRGSEVVTSISSSRAVSGTGGAVVGTNGSPLVLTSVMRSLNGITVSCSAVLSIVTRVEQTDPPANLTLAYPPEYTLHNTLSTTATEGTSVYTYQFRLDAGPIPTAFNWTKDSQVVASDNRITLSVDSITIRNITRDDSGTYIVTSRNGAGVDMANFTLDVQYPPSINVNESPRRLMSGDPFILNCTPVASNPQPTAALFYFNGSQLSGPRISEFVLTISSIKREERGVYSCTVHNTIGSVTAEVTVNVLAPPTVPRDLDFSNIQSFSSTVSWSPPEDNGGDPNPLTYRINVTNDTVTMMYNTSGVELQLTNLQHSTNYTVSLVAVNVFGSSQSAVVGVFRTPDTAPIIHNVTSKAVSLSSVTVNVVFLTNGGQNVQAIMITVDGITKTDSTPICSNMVSINVNGLTLSRGTDYDVSVAATNSFVTSEPVTGTLSVPNPPNITAPPFELSPSNITTCCAGVRLNLADPDDVSDVSVLLNTSSDGSYEMVSAGNLTRSGDILYIMGLQAGTVYTASITVSNIFGTATKQSTLKPLLGRPSNPARPTVRYDGTTVTVVLSTDYPGTERMRSGSMFSFQLQFIKDGRSARQSDTQVVPATLSGLSSPVTTTYQGVLSGGSYTVRVTAVNEHGSSESVVSEEFVVTEPPVASLNTPVTSLETIVIILAVIIAVLVFLLVISTVYSILVTIKLRRVLGTIPKGAKTSELVYDEMEMKPPSGQTDREMTMEKNPAYEAVNVGTTTEYEEVGGGRRE